MNQIGPRFRVAMFGLQQAACSTVLQTFCGNLPAVACRGEIFSVYVISSLHHAPFGKRRASRITLITLSIDSVQRPSYVTA
ncbi:hypothetical protein RRG08_062602 [Elysia crispata]|uniref:Uncharacterized protein n=1 Tax=Elysia crispata TaxID=231223 RepID=A0AAE0YYI6_9GAST|nr:hypothetical protein RRG08_062602 [Elysia crispata]